MFIEYRDSYSYYRIQIFIAHQGWDCRNNRDIHFKSYSFLIVIAQFQNKTFFEITCFINNAKQTPLFLVDHLGKNISDIPYKEMVSLQNE